MTARTFSFNVYFDPKDGHNRTLFPRTRESAKWEREVAIPENWWGAGHLIPAYVVHVTEKSNAPSPSR